MPNFSYENGGYQPALPSGYLDEKEVITGWNAVKVALKKRPSFHESIRGALEKRWTTRAFKLPDGQKVLQYRCGACQQWGEGAFMHLGHKENWEKYIGDKRPRSLAALYAAYNDLSNLRFEHIACNVSHIFENLSARAIEALDRAGIFEKLRTRYEDTGVAEGSVMPLKEHAILLAKPIVNHREKGPVELEGLTRPNWDRSTRAGLYTIWLGNKWVKKCRADDGSSATFYRCGSCGNWGEGHSMHLGHLVNWRQYLKDCGVRSVAEARWAYNDLSNLKFEHPTCNMGHEWEELANINVVDDFVNNWIEENRDKDFVRNFEAQTPEEKRRLSTTLSLICIAALERVFPDQATDEDGVMPDLEGFEFPTDGHPLFITKQELQSLKAAMQDTDRDMGDEPDVTLAGITLPRSFVVGKKNEIEDLRKFLEEGGYFGAVGDEDENAGADMEDEDEGADMEDEDGDNYEPPRKKRIGNQRIVIEEPPPLLPPPSQEWINRLRSYEKK